MTGSAGDPTNRDDTKSLATALIFVKYLDQKMKINIPGLLLGIVMIFRGNWAVLRRFSGGSHDYHTANMIYYMKLVIPVFITRLYKLIKIGNEKSEFKKKPGQLQMHDYSTMKSI